MQKIFILLCIVLITYTTNAQTISATFKPIKGLTTNISNKNSDVIKAVPQNQVYNLDIKVPKTKEQWVHKASQTSNTAVYKKENHVVYTTNKGKLFIVLPNKDNTGYYRKYIPNI